MPDNDQIKTPWHLWAVGVISLLWNAVGAFDFTMTQLRVEAYMAEFTQPQLDFFYSFPQWVQASWAIAVWFSVLGSIYLLLRKSGAVPLFTVSLIAMAATFIHNNILSETTMIDVAGTGALIFTLVIIVIAILLVFYARHMRERRVLS